MIRITDGTKVVFKGSEAAFKRRYPFGYNGSGHVDWNAPKGPHGRATNTRLRDRIDTSEYTKEEKVAALLYQCNMCNPERDKSKKCKCKLVTPLQGCFTSRIGANP